MNGLPEEAVEASLRLFFPHGEEEARRIRERVEAALQAALPALEQHFRRKLLDGLSKGGSLSEALYQLVRQDAADEARKELARALLSDEAVEALARQLFAWAGHSFAWGGNNEGVERRYLREARSQLQAAASTLTKGDGG